MTWTLHLQLVEKAGAPDPGTPGSGAAVDLGCTNAGVGVAEPQKTIVEVGNGTTSFVWHHPDAADSVPPGRYHCDHMDMGPHGHQGLVKVIVADKEWECTATRRLAAANASSAFNEALVTATCGHDARTRAEAGAGELRAKAVARTAIAPPT